jgi:hypothetical protein
MAVWRNDRQMLDISEKAPCDGAGISFNREQSIWMERHYQSLLSSSASVDTAAGMDRRWRREIASTEALFASREPPSLSCEHLAFAILAKSK